VGTARRALLVAPRAPQPVQGGFDLRILQHAVVLRRAGFDVHLFSVDPAVDPAAGNDELGTIHTAADPSALAVQSGADADRWTWIGTATNPYAAVATPAVQRDLAAALDAARPDVVVVSGHEAAGLLPCVRGAGAAVVLDLHNVLAEIVQAGDDGRATGAAGALLRRRAVAAARQVDADLMALADEVWCCSDVDAEQLRACGAETPVVPVANGIDVDRYGPPAPDDAPRLVFTASYRYLPNVLAAQELLDALGQLPGVHLDLVGAHVQPDLRARVDATPRAACTGRVDDVRPYLSRAWVAPMPLRGGSGTRLKAAEAAAAGLPIVATAKAVEGIPFTDGVDVVRAEQPSAVVDAIGRLLGDEDERARIGMAARAFAQEHLSWDAAARQVAPSLDRLVGAAR
jgi:glycosyltransferase involved in cell wall biosynthesis